MNDYKFIESELSSFDFETTGLNAWKGADYFSYCIGIPILDCDGNVEDAEVTVRRIDNKDEGLNRYNRDLLHEYWRQKKKRKTIHNFKFELHFLDKNDIVIPSSTIIDDTMIMSQLNYNLNPSNALDYLGWLHFKYPRDLDEQVKIAAKAVGNNYQKIDKTLMTKYQIADGERGLLLHYLLYEKIRNDFRLYKDYKNEIELIKVTQQMEKHGILLDIENIMKLKSWLTEQLDKVRIESFELLNEFVNLNSDDQVSRLLFRKYKFPILTLTEKGKPSVDKDVLAELQRLNNHPIFSLILRQRSYSDGLAKIKTYLKFGGENKRINPNINTNIARTGRQSSSGPNLQNVSKKEALKNQYPVPLRVCFRSDLGCVLLLPDYSGIEMRLIIDGSNELELIEMLIKDRTADMHHPTVECFLGVEQSALLRDNDKAQYKVFRSAFKNVGFCIAYGGGPDKVAKTIMKSVSEIREGDSNYRKRFQRIANFTQDIISEVKANGYITTAFGRKLYIPRGKAFIGSNYLIQGTAAGILKRAQVRVAKFLNKEFNGRIKLVLPIHDEIIMSYPRNLLSRKNEILSEISSIMTDMKEIKIPLEVEWKMTTTDWNSAKAISIKE